MASFLGCSFVATVCFNLADLRIFATSPNEVFSASIKPLAWLYGRWLFFRRKNPTCYFIVSFDILKLQLPTQPIFQRVHFSLLVKPSVEIAPVSFPKNRFRLGFTFCKVLFQQLLQDLIRVFTCAFTFSAGLWGIIL